MRSVPWITLYVGLFVAGGYLGGSALRWRRWTTPYEREAARARHEASAGEDQAGRIDPSVVDGAVEGAFVVGWALVVLWATDYLAPGSTTFRDASSIGFLSSHALTAWESASLWSGLAAICGLTFPVPMRPDRGSSGFAAASALVVAFFPLAGFICAGAYFGANIVRHSQRLGTSVVLLAMPVTGWILSIGAVPNAWGFLHGPETALWLAVLAGVVAARRRLTIEQF